MLIKIGYELIFDIPSPVNILMALYVRPEVAHVLTQPEWIIAEPDIAVQSYIDKYGNRIGRIFAPAGKLRLTYENIARDSGQPEGAIDGARLHPVEELPSE